MHVSLAWLIFSLQKPLALAKILGAYSIGFKNSKTGSSKRMDVVVMENLLYGRSFSQVCVKYSFWPSLRQNFAIAGLIKA